MHTITATADLPAIESLFTGAVEPLEDWAATLDEAWDDLMTELDAQARREVVDDLRQQGRTADAVAADFAADRQDAAEEWGW